MALIITIYGCASLRYNNDDYSVYQ